MKAPRVIVDAISHRLRDLQSNRRTLHAEVEATKVRLASQQEALALTERLIRDISDYVGDELEVSE